MRTVIAWIFDYSLDGYSEADGGVGFWRSLIRRNLIDEYRISLVPYPADKGEQTLLTC